MRIESERYLLLGLSLALMVSLAGAGDSKNWTAEVGTEVSHRDNFFFRADDPQNPPPSATLTTLYANGEVELKSGRSKWTLGGEASGSYTNDVQNANYTTAGVAAEYKRKKTRAAIEYAYLPNRVFSEEADGVFFDLSGVEFGLRQSFGRGFWIGAEYSIDAWDFSASENGRDAVSQEIGATLRFPVARNAGIRAFVVSMEKDAESPEYDWLGVGYGLALEWAAARNVSIFARVKARDRDYENAPATDSNFERTDTTLDGLLNLRWQVRRTWGLGFSGKYRDGESTRADRNYAASEAGFVLFFTL